MDNKTKKIQYFRSWQASQKKLRVSHPVQSVSERLCQQLDHTPPVPLIGYEGRLYECWLFFQFYSGAIGAHTPNGTVFVHGWRGLQFVLKIAKILRMPELTAALETTWDTLSKFSHQTLDNYDKLFGINLKAGENIVSLPENTVSEIAKLLDIGFDKVVRETRCEGVKGIDQSGLVPIGISDNRVYIELAKYIEAMIDEHPVVIAELGPVDSASVTEIPLENDDSHAENAARAMEIWGSRDMLAYCTQNKLWLKRRRFWPISSEPPISHQRVQPSFFTTNKGLQLCLIGFGDGSMLLDLHQWIEITRCYYDRTQGRGEGLPSLLLMKDEPQFFVDDQDYKIVYDLPLPKHLIYKS